MFCSKKSWLSFLEIFLSDGLQSFHILAFFIHLLLPLCQFVLLVFRLSFFFVDGDQQFLTIFIFLVQFVLEHCHALLQILRVLLCFIQLIQTASQLGDFIPDFLPFHLKQFTVTFDQFDVVGGSHIVHSLQLFEHFIRQVDDLGVCISEEI